MGSPLGTGGEQPQRSAGEDQCGCGPCSDPRHLGVGRMHFVYKFGMVNIYIDIVCEQIYEIFRDWSTPAFLG